MTPHPSKPTAADDCADALDLLSPEERSLQREWNATETDYPRSATVHQLFAEQLHKSPDRVALIYGSDSWTYTQLDQHATRIAHYLLKQGLEPKSTVGIMIPRSLEMVAAMLGILKAGGIYVPLEPSYPLQRLQFMVEDTQVEQIVTITDKQSICQELNAQAVCVDQILALPEATLSLPEKAQLAIAAQGTEAEDPCYIVFTSGSTGRPKGAAIPHRGIVRLVRSGPWIDFQESDIFLQHSAQSFDLSVFEIWGPLLNGAKVVIAPQGVLSLEELGSVVQQNRISTLWLTSGLFHQMVNHRVKDLAKLKYLLVGGDIISAVHARRLLEQCPGVTMICCYGPTENSTFCTYRGLKCPADIGEGPLPIGRSLPNSTNYILDDQLRELPIGVQGEIYCGGDGLATGYVNRPELTAELFQDHTFADGRTERLYRTGDLGSWRADGMLDFQGRADRQVKVRGFRVELGEVEAILHQHPAVGQATVVVETSSDAHKRMIAYLAMGDHAILPPAEIREYLSDRMPEYMIPTFFVCLPRLPLNSNGKVDYKALPKPTREPAAALPVISSHITPAQQQLLEIWEEVFHVKPLTLSDEFFDLGGDSMLAVVLLAKVEQTFGKSLALTDLIRHSRIAEFSTLLDRSNAPAHLRHDVLQIHAGSKQPPLFYVPCIHANLFTIRELAKRLQSDRMIYGLQPIGVDGQGTPHSTMEQITQHYLEQIRSVQPHGPYLLMGYSIGGTAAYMMAQKLQEQGEQIQLLMLVDAPRRWRPRWFTAIQHAATAIKEQFGSIAYRLGLSKVSPAAPLPHAKMLAAHLEAITNYSAKPFTGPVVLLRNSAQHGLFKRLVDNSLGLFEWEGYIDPASPVIKLPGDHTTIFQGTNIDVMAQEVRRLLNNLP